MASAPLAPHRLSDRQACLLQLIRQHPGSRGHHLVVESNYVLSSPEPKKKLSSGWGALNRLHIKGLVRIERSKAAGPGPYAIRYFITAEGRTALDKHQERKER